MQNIRVLRTPVPKSPRTPEPLILILSKAHLCAKRHDKILCNVSPIWYSLPVTQRGDFQGDSGRGQTQQRGCQATATAGFRGRTARVVGPFFSSCNMWLQITRVLFSLAGLWALRWSCSSSLSHRLIPFRRCCLQTTFKACSFRAGFFLPAASSNST